MIWYHFVQFQKREKHPWRSVILVKLQAKSLYLTKSNIPLWVFFTFLNCTNGTKSHKTSHQNLLSICENWKIVACNLFGKLKIDGNLVVKSKVPLCSGSVALRQLNPIHKKGLERFFLKIFNTLNKTHSKLKTTMRYLYIIYLQNNKLLQTKFENYM